MTIREARKSVGITQRTLSERLEIPLRTIEDWERGVSSPPKYVESLIVKEILNNMNKDKEILNRGYVTYMLTNENGEIYGTDKSKHIAWEVNKIEQAHTFYWSEVYVEAGYFATIIRKGKLLINPTPAELADYFNRSKKNFAL